jgi:hypothetical protein
MEGGIVKRTNLEACFAVVVAVFLCGSPALGAGMLTENVTAPYGKFGGVDYVVHTGRFVGSTSTGDYRVPYEIVAPADPRRGNDTVIVEPSHFLAGTAARDLVLGPELLFGEGFTYAAVGWSFDGNSILDPSATDVFIDGGDGFEDVEIISDFARALRAGPALPDLGDVEAVYGFGYSQTSAAFLTVLYSPAGQGLLDFSLLTVLPAAFLGPVLPQPFSPPHLGGRMIVAQSEADLILWGGALVRGDDDLFPEYRSYELAGMPHVPATTAPALFKGVPQQDWRPFARALFLAGHDWAANGVEPPPSVAIDSSAPGEVDPVYGWPTGIARDEIGNALGGARAPDLELGRGHFVAADFTAPFPPPPGFIGAFIDLRCTEAFRAAFPSHGRYVSVHRHEVNSLVRQRFLLREDARDIFKDAVHSDVGKPGSCP